MLLLFGCRSAAVCCVYWQVSFEKPNEMRYFYYTGGEKKQKVQQKKKKIGKVSEIIHNS